VRRTVVIQLLREKRCATVEELVREAASAEKRDLDMKYYKLVTKALYSLVRMGAVKRLARGIYCFSPEVEVQKAVEEARPATPTNAKAVHYKR